MQIPSKHLFCWRRLPEDKYIHFSHSSSRRFDQNQYIRLGHSSSRRLQDVFKTFWRRLQDILKTYHQVKLFLLARLPDVLNTFLIRTAKTVIYRRICLGYTSKKFMVSVQNLEEWYKFFKLYFFTLLHLLVAAYRDIFRTWPALSC